MGQALVNLGTMIFVLYITEKIDPIGLGEVKSLDEKFAPTLINTIMFIFQMMSQTITFIVNYTGEPFMENLSQNSAMKKLILAIFALSIVIIFDLYPQLNETLELVPLPDDVGYKALFCGLILFNFVVCFLLEKWKNLFGFYKPYSNEKKKNRE